MELIYRWFWRLVPANPILVRVVSSGSRRMRHLYVRMGYLGALVAVVLFVLLTIGGLQAGASLSDLAKAGARLFQFISYTQVVLICLMAPIFMAGAIATEQAGKTMDIMLTTPMTNLQIVLGSLLGRLYFILALLFSGLPLFAVLLIFGGVPVQSVFVSFAVAAMSAVVVGAVAITLAVLRAGGRKAVFVFVIAIAAYLAGAYVLDRAILRQFEMVAPGYRGTTWLTPLHPLLVLEASMSAVDYRPPPPEVLMGYSKLAQFYVGRPFQAFMAISGVISMVLIVWASINVRAVGQGEGKWAALVRRVRQMLGLTTGGGGERRHEPREVWTNPIAWREASTRGHDLGSIVGRWSFLVVGVLLAVGLLALYHHNALPSLRNVGGADDVFRRGLLTLLMIELSVIMMVAIYMSAGSVSREREDGTLDLMLTTPITPKYYIWGKLRGLVSFLTLLLATPVVTLLIVGGYAWFTSDGHRVALVLPEGGLVLALSLVPFVALCVMVGINRSLSSRGVVGAVISALAVLAPFVLLLGFCGYGLIDNEVPLVGPVVNAFSPVTNMYLLVNPDDIPGYEGTALGARLSMVFAALVAAGGYGAVIYGLLMNVVRNFDQTVRKLSGTN